MKVLVSDKISDKGVEILKKAGLDVDVKTGMKPDELKACIGEYHGLVIRSATKATAEIIEAAKNLKVIGRAGSGLDNVDKAAASKKGIVVMNTPGGNTVSTAEHTMSMMLALSRNIPQADKSIKNKEWERKPPVISDKHRLYILHKPFDNTEMRHLSRKDKQYGKPKKE